MSVGSVPSKRTDGGDKRRKAWSRSWRLPGTIACTAEGHGPALARPRRGVYPPTNSIARCTSPAGRSIPCVGERHRYLPLVDGMSLCAREALWVDAEEFESAAAAPAASGARCYRAAIELYAGELLPGDLYET